MKGLRASTDQRDPTAGMPRKFAELLDCGLEGVAWEYMRRDVKYKKAYDRATGKSTYKFSEEDVAAAFGLKKLKDYGEWYFEGDRPQFNVLPAARFRYERMKFGKAQKHTLRLAKAQIALTFDLRVPLGLLLELAKRELRAQLRTWLKEEKFEVKERVKEMKAASIADHIKWLRAFDMAGIKSASKIARRIYGPFRTTKEEKNRGDALVKRAKAMVQDGDYRLLIAGAGLGLDRQSGKRKVKKAAAG